MTHTFDPRSGLVIVPVFVAGPGGAETFRFALDTGATHSAMSGLLLERLGYPRSEARGSYLARTGGGATRTAAVRVARFGAFGRVEVDHPLLWLPLDPTSAAYGLLGLDFFRGQRLDFDFARGRVTLSPPRAWWWQFWR
ncbi:MAG: retroviral-like aspartic protease family protein [Gemmataceae bacterium]|nr:retroviral-like aspartic protease family protein [Gemmataceae bacterium]